MAIHSTIQIELTLFKFVALFKIRGTIQIRNMNSARALTREWIRHPNSTIQGTSMVGGAPYIGGDAPYIGGDRVWMVCAKQVRDCYGHD